LATIDDDECVAFGQRAVELDLVIGEALMDQNLLTRDLELREERVQLTRTMLHKADLMGCRCVVTLVGTQHPSDFSLAPWPGMDSDEARDTYREIILRILDDVELDRARLVTEPWCNTFYYQPEAIRAFIDTVDDPRYGVHLDLMNMVTRDSYYETGELARRTLDCLGDVVASVHFKDILWDENHLFLKLDEVPVGDGVLDYESILPELFRRLSKGTTGFCEGFREEGPFEVSFGQLHAVAQRRGLSFHRRRVS
jgi:sugar phosphate isomerase/epimerase